MRSIIVAPAGRTSPIAIKVSFLTIAISLGLIVANFIGCSFSALIFSIAGSGDFDKREPPIGMVFGGILQLIRSWACGIKPRGAILVAAFDPHQPRKHRCPRQFSDGARRAGRRAEEKRLGSVFLG